MANLNRSATPWVRALLWTLTLAALVTVYGLSWLLVI